MQNDVYYMRKALALAQKAAAGKEVPVGALVVSSTGEILGRGYNKVILKKTQIMHAEMIALDKASRKLGDWRLNNCTLYVTLQPCLMCLGFATLSRVSRIVYGAESPLFGVSLDKGTIPDLYKKHIAQVVAGVCGQEAQQIVVSFFKKRRKKDEL
jgi:tRNA(adenine34) deaminase